MINFRKLMGYTACGLIMSAFALSADAMIRFGKLNQGMSYKEAKNSQEAQDKIDEVHKFMNYLNNGKHPDTGGDLTKEQQNAQLSIKKALQDYSPEKQEEVVYEMLNAPNNSKLNIKLLPQKQSFVQNKFLPALAQLNAKTIDKQKGQFGDMRSILDNTEEYADKFRGAFENLNASFRQFSRPEQLREKLNAIDVFKKELNGLDAQAEKLTTSKVGKDGGAKATAVQAMTKSITTALELSRIFVTDSCKTTLLGLQEQIAELDRTNSSLDGKIGSLRIEQEELRKSIAAKEAQIKDLETLNNRISEEAQKRQSKLTQDKEELKEKTNTIINEKENQIKKLKQANEALIQQIEQHKQEIKANNGQIKSLREHLSTVQNTYAKQRALVANLQEQLQNVKKSDNQKIEELMEAIRRAKQKQEKLKGQLKELSETVTKAQKDSGNKEIEIAKLNETLINQKGVIAKQTRQLHDLKTNLGIAEDHIEALKSDIDALSADLDKKNESLRKLQNELGQTSQENKEYSKEVTNLTAQIAEAEKEKSALESRLETLRAQLDNAGRDARDKEIEIANLNETVRAQKGTISKQTGQLSNLQANLENAEDHIETLGQDMKANDKILKAHIALLKHYLENERTDHEATLQSLSAQLDTQQAKLSQAKAQLTETEDAYIRSMLATLVLCVKNDDKVQIALFISSLKNSQKIIIALWPKIFESSKNKEFTDSLDVDYNGLDLPEKIDAESLIAFGELTGEYAEAVKD